MTANLRQQFDKVFLQLENLGLLLVSDSVFPNVYQLIAGDGRKGSWWGSEHGQTIFAVNELLEDHRDVMLMKLVSGKVTFVHRELWGHAFSIGVAREEWQLEKLSSNAKSLLKSLDKEGTLQTNKLGKDFGPKPGEIAKELELRMLAHVAQVHSESGAHTKVLRTWQRWAQDVGFRPAATDPAAARKSLEKRVREIKANTTLPWTQR